jgi:type IV pilus assembly protein PilQ
MIGDLGVVSCFMKLLMRIYIACTICLLGTFFQTNPLYAKTAKNTPNIVQNLVYHHNQQSKQAHLTLRATKDIRYTTFELDNPHRLILDLHNADLRNLQRPYRYTRGPVRNIGVQQFADNQQFIGRLIISLQPNVRWQVKKQPNSLILWLHERDINGDTSTQNPSVPISNQGVNTKTNSVVVPIKKLHNHLITKQIGNIAKDKVQKPSNSGVLIERSGIKRGGSTGQLATLLQDVSISSNFVRIQTNGTVKSYEILRLHRPMRMAIDLYGVKRYRSSLHQSLRKLDCQKQVFRSVRIGRHADKLRLVLDVCPAQKVPHYNPIAQRNGLWLNLLATNSQEQEPTQKLSAKQPSSGGQRDLNFASEIKTGSPQITELGFGQTDQYSTIMIQINGPLPTWKKEQSNKEVALILTPASLAPQVQKLLDLSDFSGALSNVRIEEKGRNVKLTVQLRQAMENRLSTHRGQLLWRFEPPANKLNKTADGRDTSYQIAYEPKRVGVAGGGGPMTAGDLAILSSQEKKRQYTGRRISIYFRKVEIHNLLHLFAEISGLNIITSDRVRGQVTLKLRNVPWDQAMDLVLRTLKLGMDREGNILRIATLEELRQEEEQRQKLEEMKLLAQPQKIRLIPVNYATASEMATQIRTVLSPRGKVSIDNRTNVLIVQDYVPFLIRAEGLVRSLDTQTPQVLIETRIVEANINFDQQFGIQWGGHLLFSPLTGNSTGLQFPNPIGIRGGVPDEGGGGNEGTFGTPNYVVNFPATVSRGRGTALSFLFGTLSGATNLQLRLSAAESNGHVKIISSPRIVTLHKMSASIQQGLQIPFTSASAAGTNVQFITASLALTVTPQVTTDGSVFLQLNITNNTPDFARGGPAGPAISTKTAQTNMLIKDGETMVIGGIYSRTTGRNVQSVPFLSKIPVLGLLFKNHTYNDDRAELLIFVTPRIINRAQTLGGRQGE